MATPAQLTANRLNAQKSTGPRSDEGKAASRFNALKHAASAQSLIIPGEDQAALAELTAQYRDQFRPVGPEENLLLDKIVAADWTQRRMHRLETEIWNALIDRQDPAEENPVGVAFIQDCEGPDALQKIFRRREAASREWYRAIAMLRQLQESRPAPRAVPAATRAKAAAPPQPLTSNPHPPAIGFVPTTVGQAPRPARDAHVAQVFGGLRVSI